MLIDTVQWVYMVICPSSWSRSEVLLLHLLNDHVAQLGTKTEVMYRVCKGMSVLILEVVLEIVHVQVAVREGFPWCNMEISNDLVDSNAAFETASFLTLLIEVLGVMLALALLHSFSATKRP